MRLQRRAHDSEIPTACSVMHATKLFGARSLTQGLLSQVDRCSFVQTQQKPKGRFKGCSQLSYWSRKGGRQCHETGDNRLLICRSINSSDAAHDQQNMSARATAPPAAAAEPKVPVAQVAQQQQHSAASALAEQPSSSAGYQPILPIANTSSSVPSPSKTPVAAAGGDRPTKQVTVPTTIPTRLHRSPNSIDTSIDMTAEARRYLLVSLAQFSMGTVLVSAPHAFMSAALNAVPTALEVLFARLMGLALLFRGLLALVLSSASERGRLHGTTAQRVMLGCILPSVSHIIAFKTVYNQWGMSWNWALMFLYPSVLGAELYTHLLAFQVYNPYFLLKLMWPLSVALVTAQLMPPIPPADQLAAKLKEVVPPTLLHKLTPVSAGAAVILSRRGVQLLVKAALWTVRAAQRYSRSRAVGNAFRKFLPEAGPPLTGTVVRMMDFFLPTSALAWGYWFMMLQHFATMFNAYMPDVLFTGAVSPISRLMKQSWSAGFLAAAFASDALKTAADRQHLDLPENRQLNLCLAMLEAGSAVCMASGMAQGTVVVSPYSYVRLATAMASVCFCMGVWWMSVKEAERKGWPKQPSISSYDWQEQTEKRPDYAQVTSMAMVALHIITCAIG